MKYFNYKMAAEMMLWPAQCDKTKAKLHMKPKQTNST